MDKSASDQTNSASEESYPHEKRNLFVFALNQILMRLGWMFKAESVVIPAFIDIYTSSGTIRGLLPLILRIGQSLPQFLVAQRVARMPKKQGFFILTGFGFTIPWCVLSLVLGVTHWSANVIVAVFLVLCTIHWLMVGCNHLANGTLQGKLISPQKRGRLLAYSNVIGCSLSIGVAIYLMPRWLSETNPRYATIFGVTAGAFGIAAFVSFWFRELPSQAEGTAPFFKFLGDALLLLRHDRNFRRFALVILLFYSIWPLFPHYAVFGKRTLGLASSGFVTLIVAQNASNALGAGVMGNIADRSGNRFVLRLLILISAFTPLLAVGISRMPSGAQLYWIIFALIGFTPVSARIVTNYTLEIAPQEKHPQYLGVMSLFQAIPLFVSPLIGALIEEFAFEPVFIICSVLVACGFVLTFRLEEPRFNQGT
ncbi:MAG: MFS transporter [Candidatus Poribacteria bacterium]|nr:MFS transporter [Candidatus Poribacteria bacterium]